MSASTCSPLLVFKRYFLSQMSSDTGCMEISFSEFACDVLADSTALSMDASP